MRERVFKTARFSRLARKAGIDDAVLCAAIFEVQRGLADNLGGGVYKKRLSENRDRAIILTKAGHFWVYQVLFAKQNKANISDADLRDLKQLNRIYDRLSTHEIEHMVQQGRFVEICHDTAA